MASASVHTRLFSVGAAAKTAAARSAAARCSCAGRRRGAVCRGFAGLLIYLSWCSSPVIRPHHQHHHQGKYPQWGTADNTYCRLPPDTRHCDLATSVPAVVTTALLFLVMVAWSGQHAAGCAWAGGGAMCLHLPGCYLWNVC